MRGLMLDTDLDIAISVKKDSNGMITQGVSIGDSTDQCAVVVLSMHQGDLKEDPIIGCGLTKFVRGRYSASKIEQRIRAHFARAGINYDDYISKLNVTINAKQL